MLRPFPDIRPHPSLLGNLLRHPHLLYVSYFDGRGLHHRFSAHTRQARDKERWRTPRALHRAAEGRNARSAKRRCNGVQLPLFQRRRKNDYGVRLVFCKRCVGTPGDTYRWMWDGVTRSVYLPRQGEVVRIDSSNFRHYSRCIEYETGLMPQLVKESVIHADTVMYSYRFKCNYYFMRGDNDADSYDSRFWGILPEDFILGVGLFTWFSKEPETGKIRWERMFKKL